MDSATIAALIGALASIGVALIAPHVTKRIQRKEVESTEATQRRSRELLFNRMLHIRETSRQMVSDISFLIASVHDGRDTGVVSERIAMNRAQVSEHTDIIFAVSQHFPGVVARWAAYQEALKGTLVAVGAFRQAGNSDSTDGLDVLLSGLISARSDLVRELKSASAQLGHPLLVRDPDPPAGPQ
ncbi:hypothetical protein ACIGO7_07675 [Streptomyces virginiae]|uniref:hypothetical protein n=1 Tax=Streptomyces virginiae TaxID=1961 RepID=UPI00344BBE14